MIKIRTTPEVFDAKLDKSGSNGCWIWTGAVGENGYGATSVNYRNIRPHRLAWEFAFGAIPNGLSVCHKCDVRLCCNPSHLFLGTAKDNSLDAVSKGRQSKGAKHALATAPNKPKGDTHPNRKLSGEQVIQMRSEWSPGVIGIKAALAARYGIAPATVFKICSGRAWKHLL